MTNKIPRFELKRSFPPYAYSGGEFPHPRNHPKGHSRGLPETIPQQLDPEKWSTSEVYLHGIDLFNHGYYWEAHEEWEGLWVAAGKKGAISEFLKGLIKLTAAGFKARQGQPEGVLKHSQRAMDHFTKTLEMVDSSSFAGFDLEKLLDFAKEVGRRAGEWPVHSGEKVAVVFDRLLLPEKY